MKNEVRNQLAQIKECSAIEIKNIDLNAGTFEKGNCVYQFDLTKTGKVKTGSVKFFNTISSYQKCI